MIDVYTADVVVISKSELSDEIKPPCYKNGAYYFEHDDAVFIIRRICPECGCSMCDDSE